MMLFAILAYLFSQSKKRNSDGVNVTPSDFLGKFYKWLSDHEGGLANGTTAGDANLKRAPCVYTINGQVINPSPHTNRGITYDFYESTGPSLGIKVSCDNFLHMPENDWRKLVDAKTKRGFAFSDNPVVARYIGLWYWGGWDQSLVSSTDVKDIINKHPNLKDQLYFLIQLRKHYFDLDTAKNHYSSGWLASVKQRADSYNTEFSNFV